MHVYKHACMLVSMYVCMHIYLRVFLHASKHTCTNARLCYVPGGTGSLVPELLSPGGTQHEDGQLRQQYGACGVVFELRLHLAGAWTGVAEANFVRELAAALRVPSDCFKVAGHASRLVPGCVEVELYSEHEWGQTVIDSVTVLASDPSSPLWALPNLAKVTVQGMVFEKSTVQGSPPKEDLFVEALRSLAPHLSPLKPFTSARGLFAVCRGADSRRCCLHSNI